MSKTINGGCKCGKVRFELDGAPLASMVCHCNGCFKRTGPYSGGMFVRTSDLKVTGEVMDVVDTGGTGMPIHMYRCASCGTPVHILAEAVPIMQIVPAQALDNQDDFTPTFHNWVSGKPEWVTISDELPQFPNSVDWDAIGGRPDFGTPRVQAASTQP